MTNAFSGQILVEKLSKLNNSQQSIETLSQWCISHRQKAKQVVETWDKLFKNAQREQRVSFLYLANDILQNSRRKGSDFVNEFWKFLPAAIRDVSENGDDQGRKAVSRLVDIWEERKVFGSRGRSLKDEMLGKESLPLSENNGKSLNLIKIVKKDAHSMRLKLAVGGMPEKIITAFQSVHEEHFREDTALNKCKAAVRRVGKLEKDAENASTHGNQQVSVLRDELQEQENVLRQCLEQLQSVEAARTSLIGQLKEALEDQETKLELIRTQYQVSQARIEQASLTRQRLGSSLDHGSTPPTTTALAADRSLVEVTQNQTSGTTPQPPLPQPMTIFASMRTATEEETKKAAAAAVAAKLAAMTSSAQMLTSVLSSLAAEEAASMNGGLQSSGKTPCLPMFTPEKKPRLEKPSSDMGSTYFQHGQQQSQPPSEASTTSIQSMPEVNQAHQFPPPPPPPPPPPSGPPPHIYMQSSNAMVGGMTYGYVASSLPPPPPLSAHMVMGLARPPPVTQPQQQQQQRQSGGYYQAPGGGFYGQNHQQQAPPLPRQ